MWVVVTSTILAPVSATRTRTFGPCTIAPSAGVTIRIFAWLLGRVVGVVVGPPPLPADPPPHAASSKLALSRHEASVPAVLRGLPVFIRVSFGGRSLSDGLFEVGVEVGAVVRRGVDEEGPPSVGQGCVRREVALGEANELRARQ